MKIIPYGKHKILEEDIEAVVKVLRSDFLTQGPMVPKFEEAISSYVSSKYAIAVNSATSALHLACLALNVGKGDLVWTSPISFVASANCALYCGADIDFVDIDPFSYNISIENLQYKLEKAYKRGKLPKVLIAVHLTGQSCDMSPIKHLSEKYGFKIIEDASHAIGGRYQGKNIGSCYYSDITVFSFHPVKIITSGEGGVCTTNDEKLANVISRLRSHGITKNPREMTRVPIGSWYYEQLDLGFNYRMTDIQAALGIAQLKRISEIIEKRRQVRDNYNEILSSAPVVIPAIMDYAESSLHLYVIQVDQKENIINRHVIFERLKSQGIQANLHYFPIYRQPFYQVRYDFNPLDFPEAEKYYSQAISLPIYPELTMEDQMRIKEAMLKPLDSLFSA